MVTGEKCSIQKESALWQPVAAGTFNSENEGHTNSSRERSIVTRKQDTQFEECSYGS